MPVIIGGSGVALSTAPIEVTLSGAQAYMVPSGQYLADVGRYSLIQYLDPGTGLWRTRQPRNGQVPLTSDGTNVRLINSTGCPAGATLTAKGSGYTNGVGTVAVTVSSGGSVWQAVVGGAFASAVTVTTAGAYNYIPSIVFPAPGVAGGLRATAAASISGGVLTSITVINRGAGWTGTVPTSLALNNTSTTPASAFYNPQSPFIQIIQDPRDTAAGGAVITLSSALADSGCVTGLVCTDPGTIGVTSLPTLAFASGTASAIVIMNWTATGFTIGGGGGTYGNSNPFMVTGVGLTNTSTPYTGDTNPTNEIGIITPRNFLLSSTANASGVITSVAAVVIDDAGFGLQRVPDALVIPANGTGAAIPSLAASLTVTVGSTTDTSWLQPFKL